MATEPVTLVVPARFGSTRFPGKPLAMLRGAGGVAKPLVQWTWEAARRVPGVERLLVATDDDRIVRAVSAFGGDAMLTSRQCRNGTERCAEVAARLNLYRGIVVNLQGDSPLTPPSAIQAIVDSLQRDPRTLVATPRVRCTPAMVERLRAGDREGLPGGTTVVVDGAENALYFSKRVLPFAPQDGTAPTFFHIGAYAYRAEALRRYAAMPPSSLEESEGLEQLRFLHAGIALRTAEVPLPDAGLWELNHPSDVAAVEAGLQAELPDMRPVSLA
jgi:3-deoxy-manno-octulosonate cytidylyltransferase (CMP-KDO synthetase)